MAKGKIKARIQCTVELEVGTWGGAGSTDLDALTEQVRSEGINALRKISTSNRFTVVGTPKVLFLLLEEE